MLASVADDEYTILRANFVQEVPHLLGAGERGLIEHVEMAVGRVACRAFLAALLQEALEGAGGDPCVAELVGGFGCGSEIFDRVALALCAFPDRPERGGFPCAGQTLQAMHAVR